MSNIYYGSRRPGTTGHKLYFRQSGTSTPQNTYTDIDLAVAHSNPVVCEADGYYPVIYLDPSLPNYRVIHTDGSNDDDDPTLEVQVEDTLDDVPSSSNQAQTYRVKGTAPEIIFEETDATTNNKKWRIRVNSEVLSIDAGNDAESSWTPMLSVTRSDVITTNGTFSGTLTGITAPDPQTVYWQKTGNIVQLRLGDDGSGIYGISGTSNTTAMTLTGMPAAIRPANAVFGPLMRVYNNTAEAIADASISPSGVIDFYLWSGVAASSASGFTNSGIKGLPKGWTLVYSLL